MALTRLAAATRKSNSWWKNRTSSRRGLSRHRFIVAMRLPGWSARCIWRSPARTGSGDHRAPFHAGPGWATWRVAIVTASQCGFRTQPCNHLAVNSIGRNACPAGRPSLYAGVEAQPRAYIRRRPSRCHYPISSFTAAWPISWAGPAIAQTFGFSTHVVAMAQVGPASRRVAGSMRPRGREVALMRETSRLNDFGTRGALHLIAPVGIDDGD